jgi:ABC-type branched-subunit amino acid transport system ATPase component
VNGLMLAEVSVRYGGRVAVDRVGLTAPPGRITGLIGPNGAGKTSLFNAASGLIPVTSGRVVLDGRDITRTSPAARARHGLGRTFQRMELFDTLTVGENVALAWEARAAGSNPLRHLLSGHSQNSTVQDRTQRVLARCGIDDLTTRPVAALSTGQRRLVELARVLAGNFSLLLLDEPSSGLDPVERTRFGALLHEIAEVEGVGILLVEHDIAMVTSICDYVWVLDFGRLIFHGSPADVTANPLVRAAYLGSVDVEVA